MKILTKYIGTTIIVYTSMVVLLLLGLQMFIEFTNEFPDIGTGDYGLAQVFSYVPLLLPYDVYQFFPMAGLIGCVIALGLMASRSELIVMRASGVSLVNITMSVVKAAAILTVIMTLVGEVVAPIAQRIASSNKTIAISGGQALLTERGVWVRSGDNFLHIDRVPIRGQLQGITRYNFDAEKNPKLISYAEGASYKDGKWIFSNVVQTTFNDESTKSDNLHAQDWGLNLNPRLIGLSSVDTDQKTLPELHSYIKYRRQGGLNASSYEFAFWQRIFAPLATLVMILLAVPFVFGPLRSATMGLRMLAGVLVGFGFHVLNQFVGPMSIVYQVPSILAAILPTLFFAAFGVFLLLKTR